MTKIAKAYANALMDLSIECSLDKNKVLKELQFVKSYYDKELVSFLMYPKISKDEKKDLFTNCFKNIDVLVLDFIKVLVDNDQIFELPSIISEFNSLINHELGLTVVNVTSLEELSSDDLMAIKKYFKNKLNMEIIIKQKIDKSLLGGYIIEYNGKVIDASLINKQQSLKEFLNK